MSLWRSVGVSGGALVSPRLRVLFFIAVVVFVVHGVEEGVTGFSEVDAMTRFFLRPLEGLPNVQATFLVFQVMWWLVLVVSFVLLLGRKWQLGVMTVVGLLFVFELHHIIKAVIFGTYYPGLVTAFAFPIIGFFFWKELLKEYKVTRWV